MKKLFPILILIAIAALAVWWLGGKDVVDQDADQEQVAPTTDPVDTVNGYYSDWLNAQKSTTTDPYTAGLATDGRLSEAVQQHIVDQQAAEQDPVLCQMAVPERTGARDISRTDFQAEVQVLSRGLPEQSSVYAHVTLTAVAGDWQISNIACVDAAAEPEIGEYSFDKEGYLLKSVPEPLNSDYWHLVFTENNVPGHTAPLFFDTESVCVAADGGESVCDESQFTEPSRAQVQGSLTEAGVDVARIVFE